MASEETTAPSETTRRKLNRFDGYAAALVALLFIIAAGMFAGYCRGSDGVAGPVGAEGQAGAKGDAGDVTTVRGPQGDPGPAGAPGRRRAGARRFRGAGLRCNGPTRGTWPYRGNRPTGTPGFARGDRPYWPSRPQRGLGVSETGRCYRKCAACANTTAISSHWHRGNGCRCSWV